MPEFVMDTSGRVAAFPPVQTTSVQWFQLDGFTQGYIEAMFFTESGSDTDGKDVSEDACFGDIAPEALVTIMADCAKFLCPDGGPKQGPNTDAIEAAGEVSELDMDAVWMKAGRDFWYTRNGHGCGFWDGDWPEPYATALTDAAHAFKSVDVYWNDGKVYLS